MKAKIETTITLELNEREACILYDSLKSAIKRDLEHKFQRGHQTPSMSELSEQDNFKILNELGYILNFNEVLEEELVNQARLKNEHDIEYFQKIQQQQ